MHDERRKAEDGRTVGATNVQALAEEIGDDVPSVDDFFGDDTKKDEVPNPFVAQTGNQRKSLLLPTAGRGKKGVTGTDAKAFDHKLVDRALHLLLDYQSIY